MLAPPKQDEVLLLVGSRESLDWHLHVAWKCTLASMGQLRLLAQDSFSPYLKTTPCNSKPLSRSNH